MNIAPAGFLNETRRGDVLGTQREMESHFRNAEYRISNAEYPQKGSFRISDKGRYFFPSPLRSDRDQSAAI